MLGHKLGQQVKSQKNLVYALDFTFSENLVKIFASIKCQMSLKLGHVVSKTGSLGQILEKIFVHSRSHIFSHIFMKLD